MHPAPVRSRAQVSRAGICGRFAGLLLALVTPLSIIAVPVLVAPPATAAPANPSDDQLKRAQAAKIKAAQDVGRLSGLIAAADAQIVHLDGLAELAKEKYLKAIWDLAQAKNLAAKARANVVAAQQAVDDARAKYRQFIVAAYINRGSDSGGLLVASDPNALLARGDLTNYTSSRQINAIGNLSRATVAKSNADAAARTAVQAQTNATNIAAAAQRAAARAVDSARSQRVVLAAQKASYQTQLTRAGMALTGLKDKRAAFLAWQEAERKRRAAEAARLAAQRRRQIEAQQNQNNASSGGGGGGGGAMIAGGSWSPAKGQAAANRALRWLGERYSFAAGNYDGPTWGACVTKDAGFNDCHVFGFDCSGLTMYAWAPAGILMPHYAASQYSYGNFHPSPDQLMPGDLVFWSSDGTVPGIHHVAIYIGGGQVVQAPQSGDVVKVSFLWTDEYYGATRPGS